MKIKKLLFLTVLATICVATAHAQVDSTSVTTSNVVTSVTTYLETKYSWITYALAAIVAIDHILAAIPSVKASSTFQLLTGWLGKLGAK